VIVAAVVAATAAGCGSQASPPPAKAPEAAAKPAPTLIVFRRVRYEGATLRTLSLHADGSVHVDVPGGGAGGSTFEGRLRPTELRGIRHTIDATPWRSLSSRKVAYIRGSGAYFMLRHRGHDYVAMADRMSRDLVPVVRSLNGVLNGGLTAKRVTHRFYTP
jgi:hypothetical protein